MSDSIEYVLAEREKKIAAIREAVALYPDAYFSGDYLVSRSLKREDCDYIHIRRLENGDQVLHAGRSFDGLVLMQEQWTIPLLVFGRMRSQDPDLYRRVLDFIATEAAY